MRGRIIELEVTDKRGKAAKTIPLYQYDYGQKLLIKGVELPEYYEVHFSNQQYGDAITVLGDSTGVLIPDSLVATGETIYVWLFLHDTSYDGETEYMGAIPVIKRAQPTDVTPTPEEQSIITEVIAALNNMEDDMSEQVQAAESAKEAAQTAQAVAESAATTASGYVDTVTAAQSAAEAAQAAAETAATSATASATSATASANSANNALAEATNAKIAAVDAASAASTSATTATTASGNASNYATSAESAKVDAVAAKVAAEAAQTAAETAQAAAEAAASALEDVIDDTAGEGDTDKTWSANKLDSEISDVLNAIAGIDDFLGDTNTDLGTHDIVTETDLINMTPGTYVDADVTFTITKTTISANGTASKNILRTAQDITLNAGYYLFAIDHPITSADYQIQLFNTGNNSIIKSFTSAQSIFDYYFTLESAVNARIRAYAVSGANVDHQLHEVTLKKISRETFDNTVAYYLTGLGSSGVGFYTGIELGSIGALDGQPISSTTRCRTKDYISVDKFALCDLTKKTGYDLYLFLYDENKNFLQRIPSDWANTYYTHASIATTYPSAKYIKIIFKRHNDGNISSVDIAEMQGVISIYQSEGTIEAFEDFRSMSNKSRFDDQFNYIAYSKLSANDAPANTEEHYLKCAKADFTALKGDVRNTADRGLIMCHDPGYTFDGNDKITTYNNSNKTLINTLTVAECKALTFAEQYNGQDCHPTDFDTYVKICKKYGKIAFVTVRDEQIDSVVAPNVIATLKKYRMMDRAIINSFTIATLTKFREYDSRIMLSLVMNQNTAPSISTVDAVMTLGNCMLNLFDVPLPSGSTLEDVLTSYDPVIRYAINNNVMVYEAQTNNSMTDTLLAHGITGSHMIQIPDYND